MFSLRDDRFWPDLDMMVSSIWPPTLKLLACIGVTPIGAPGARAPAGFWVGSSTVQ